MDEETLLELEELKTQRSELLSDITTLQNQLNEVNEQIIQFLEKIIIK